MKDFFNNEQMLLLACLTLGLALFNPPHIWGKLQWMAGGANGMQATDWFEVLLHGTPWLLFLRFLILKYLKPKSATKAE